MQVLTIAIILDGERGLSEVDVVAGSVTLGDGALDVDDKEKVEENPLDPI